MTEKEFLNLSIPEKNKLIVLHILGYTPKFEYEIPDFMYSIENTKEILDKFINQNYRIGLCFNVAGSKTWRALISEEPHNNKHWFAEHKELEWAVCMAALKTVNVIK